MDNRDEIIRTQMDVISTLVNNNLKNIADDLWGAPPKRPETPPARKPDASPKPTPSAAPST